MTCTAPGQSIESDAAWVRGEAEVASAMGAINLATAALVATIRFVIDTNA